MKNPKIRMSELMKKMPEKDQAEIILISTEIALIIDKYNPDACLAAINLMEEFLLEKFLERQGKDKLK